MNRRGFTLMEVTLFLAISSMLSLIAFVGLGPRLRNVRFTDSVRGAEAQASRIIADSRSGSNQSSGLHCMILGSSLKIEKVDDATPGTSQDCVKSGVILSFKSGSEQIEYQTVIARRTKACNEEVDFDNFHTCYWARPLLPDDGVQPNTVDYANGMKQTSDDALIGYFRDPESNKEYLFIDGKGKDATARVCYELNGRKASLNFSTDSINPVAKFNDEACQ